MSNYYKHLPSNVLCSSSIIGLLLIFRICNEFATKPKAIGTKSNSLYAKLISVKFGKCLIASLGNSVNLLHARFKT